MLAPHHSGVPMHFLKSVTHITLLKTSHSIITWLLLLLNYDWSGSRLKLLKKLLLAAGVGGWERGQEGKEGNHPDKANILEYSHPWTSIRKVIQNHPHLLFKPLLSSTANYTKTVSKPTFPSLSGIFWQICRLPLFISTSNSSLGPKAPLLE